MCRTRVDDFPFTYFRNEPTEYLNALFEECKVKNLEWRNFDPETEAKLIADVSRTHGRSGRDKAKDKNPILFYKKDEEKKTAIKTLQQLGIEYKLDEKENKIEVVEDMNKRYLQDGKRFATAILYDFINTIDPKFALDKKAEEILTKDAYKESAAFAVIRIRLDDCFPTVESYELHNSTFPSEKLRAFFPKFKETNFEYSEKYSENGLKDLTKAKILSTGDSKNFGFDHLAGLAKFSLSNIALESEKKIAFFNQLRESTKLPDPLNKIIMNLKDDLLDFVDTHISENEVVVSFAESCELYNTYYVKNRSEASADHKGPSV